MQFFDTHCHLNLSPLKEKLPEVIAGAHAKNVDYMISVGCDMEESRLAMEASKQYENLFYSVGVHPCHEGTLNLDLLREWGRDAVAIGEIGLDFFHPGDRIEQEEIFRQQLELAKELNKPVIIHARDAEAESLAIVKESGIQNAVFHCYTGSKEIAQQIIEAGYLISFTGIITYPKADHLRELIVELPLEKIMIETDSPYLAPQSRRGEVCTPADVVEVAEKIAEIKNLPLTEIAEITTQTAKNFFQI